MQLGKQIYSRPTKGKRCVQIAFNPDETFTYAINWTGFAWTDHKYQLVKNLIKSSRPSVLVTDNDLIAHNDYIGAIPKGMIVVLVYQSMSKPYSLNQRLSNVAFNGCGASKKRLQNAKVKLQAAGVKVKLFTSEKTCLNYLAKIRGVK